MPDRPLTIARSGKQPIKRVFREGMTFAEALAEAGVQLAAEEVLRYNGADVPNMDAAVVPVPGKQIRLVVAGPATGG